MSQCSSIAANYGQQCQLESGHEGFHKAGGSEWWDETQGDKPRRPHAVSIRVTDEQEDAVKVSPTLKVTEIFYSLQGEGGRAGEPSVFIRLSGCSAKHACAAAGVICDTEFESGKELSLDKLLEHVLVAEFVALNPEYTQEEIPAQMLQSVCKWIVFTGGEPLDQLTAQILNWFKHKGYKIAIETSGLRPIDEYMATCIDYITVSPKVAEHILQKNLSHLIRRGAIHEGSLMPNVEELRYVRHSGQPGVPQPSLRANHYYLSPHSDGQEINRENLQHCIRLCLENPMWRLSVQQHKLFGIL